MDALLVTGGAGFIGSNFVRYLLNHYPCSNIIVLDVLSYAANLSNLDGIINSGRLQFVQGDICNRTLVKELMSKVDAVINFAAESHVDRSILDPSSFITTNYNGVYILLEVAKELGIKRFLQVSTDEVYGHVPDGLSIESDPFMPRSPYAASKAAADLLVQSYFTTYELPVLTTRGSNTIGPYQYPEKVLPIFITQALENQPLPIYGDGSAVRSYVYVEDHCSAIDLVLRSGQVGSVYNVGTNYEVSGTDLADAVLNLLDRPKNLRKFVRDRSGHDLRYALDCSAIKSLGWRPRYDFQTMLEITTQWYIDHKQWWQEIKKSSNYQNYYENQYLNR
tara:strand:- start:13252 stop:14256 length:1005 start_codon:yes stop_codon:yes gene_type:complete